MIVPSKMTALDNSILGKMSNLIVEDVNEILVKDLLELKLRKFADIGEFLLALDTLFALGKIELDEEKGIIKYVG